MSTKPTVNGTNPSPPTDGTVIGNGESVPELMREIERLRAQLAQATEETERYKKAAYALLNERVPYSPPNEDEIRDMVHGPRGRPLTELIDALEREGEG